MTKRVILTGATGFIGRQTIPFLLRRGFEVHALIVKNTTRILGSEIRCHQVDIFDYKAVSRICKELKAEYLLHLAWQGGANERMTSPENLSWVEASLNLVQAFSKNGGSRIVLAGSCAEYNWQYGYCSENLTPTEPESLYGECKSSLHKLTYKFCQNQGIHYSNGRIFFVSGPSEAENRLVPYITKSLLMDQKAEIKHSNRIRDYLNVTDVADALVTLLHSSVEGPVNIGSGQPTSLGELANLIGKKMHKPELIALNTAEESDNKAPIVLADITRLQNELGWKPKYDLENGIEATIQWWKKQNQIMINK